MLNNSDMDLIVHLAGCSLAKTSKSDNWVDEVGGLPEYLCRIARAVMRSGGHTVSSAIAIAVGRAKTWARGGGGVNADTRAKAAKAIAEWEAKKTKAKANNKVKLSNDITLYFSNSYNVDQVRKQYGAQYANTTEYRWVREMWSDHLIVMQESSNGESSKFIKVPYSVGDDGKATFGDEVEVKQAYVELSSTDLQTSLTDAQLELAAKIPCTEKDRGSLTEMVALSAKKKELSPNFIAFTADKPNLAKLLRG